jgi:uncharacterized protein (DUF1015 family)
MSFIRPFAGLRPVPKYAQAVIAPPYDVLTSEEARARAQNQPRSFLHVSKPEIDLPTDIDPYADEVYAKGAENLHRLIEAGVLKQDTQSCYYLYELSTGEQCQIGLVAVANVADYDSQRIRKHELTRPAKEDDRVRHIDVLNAQTGPVFLIYKHRPELDSIIHSVTSQVPTLDVKAKDGVNHRLWVISDQKILETITQLFEQMERLYIADGHHRSAAASRVAALRQAKNSQHQGQEAYNYFLSVIFPDNQLKILDYNRVVRDLNGLTPPQFLTRLAEQFTVQPSAQAVKPQRNGEFGVFLANQWYQLTIHASHIPTADPVASLDVSLLTDFILTPILGIADLRRDERIDFVGGIRGLTELEKRVNSGEMAVAFSLYPTTVEALLAVADAGQIMPPKSTWFEPKLADGLVSHLL